MAIIARNGLNPWSVCGLLVHPQPLNKEKIRTSSKLGHVRKFGN